MRIALSIDTDSRPVICHSVNVMREMRQVSRTPLWVACFITSFKIVINDQESKSDSFGLFLSTS